MSDCSSGLACFPLCGTLVLELDLAVPVDAGPSCSYVSVEKPRSLDSSLDVNSVPLKVLVCRFELWVSLEVQVGE